MLKYWRTWVGVSVLACFLALPASGSIIGNLSGTSRDTGDDNVTNLGNWRAIAFQMTGDYVISGLDLLIQVSCSGNPEHCGTVQGYAGIHANDVDHPGTAVGSFGLPSWSQDEAWAVHNFTANIPFTLAAGQTYWLVVYGINPTGKRQLEWAHYGSTNPLGPPLGDGAIYATPGMSGGNHSLRNGALLTDWNQGPWYPIFNLSGDPLQPLPPEIPEPGTWLMMGSALIGLSALGQRMRRIKK